MALPSPNLDDRGFQDLVREARSMIPKYCPEWTDHNLSDPGITLIELFAWMVDVLLYRVNRVPEKNYIKFLEMIGVQLAPPSPASVDITFKLATAQPGAITVPAGTEVATVRTETQEAITFTTDAPLRIDVPQLTSFLITRDGTHFVDFLDDMGKSKVVDFFKEVPQAGNAFYLGFKESLAGNVLAINMDCVTAKGMGVIPDAPPLVWEYWDGAVQDWQAFARRPEADAWMEKDATGALNRKGDIVFHVPRTFAAREVGMRTGYWVRCWVTDAEPAYKASPAVKDISCTCTGGTIPASHGIRISGEVLGESNGMPGQRFNLQHAPLLALHKNEVVEILEDGSVEAWQLVENFSQSGPEDKHFCCDQGNGEIQLGPGIRQQDGQMKYYGAVPPKGRTIRMSGYRYGGGSAGNVGKNTLVVLKSSIPYIASVTNRKPAAGGADAERIENALMRGPQMFRTRNRAVTEADFEFLAMEASSSVARAKCIQPRESGDGGPLAGVVMVLIVPAVTSDSARIPPEQLELSQELMKVVRTYLDERRLLTTLLVITEPNYVWVSVDVKARVKAGFDLNQVKADIETKLYRLINPLTGGPQERGWPFGRDLIVSEIYSNIQNVDGVEYVEEARIHPVDIATGKRGEATHRLKIGLTSVICSHEHLVRVEFIE